MSSERTIRPADDEKIREHQPSDIGGSGPEFTKSDQPFQDDRSLLRQTPNKVPDEVVERSRRRSLLEEIRSRHEGEGLVAINQRTGEVLAVADDSREMMEALTESPVPPQDRLVIDCYE